MRCSRQRDCVSASTAAVKPWSRSATGSRLKERSRSAPPVVRVRPGARSRISRACSRSPRRTRSSVASSMSATPESDCTGPSWRKRAIRLRSSCSAARTCSARSRSASSLAGLPLVDDGFTECDRDCVRARVRLELGEDVPDVALYRLLADEELCCDVGVRHAVGEELEDLALPPGEHVVLVAAGQEGGHESRVDIALAARDLLDRPQERLVRRLLQDIALGARLEAAAEEAPLAVGGEDENGAVGHP